MKKWLYGATVLLILISPLMKQTMAQTNSGSTRTDMYALSMWVKSDGSVSYNNGLEVFKWHDESGEDHHLTNGKSKAPRFISGENGKPATIYFRNARAGLKAANLKGKDLFAADKASFYFIIDAEATGQWFSWKADANNVATFATKDNQLHFRYASGKALKADLPETESDFYMIAGVKTENEQKIFINGRKAASMPNSKAIAPEAVAHLYIGNNGNSRKYGLSGSIAEMLVFNRSLKQAERKTIGQYLSGKYDVDYTTSNNPAQAQVQKSQQE